MIRSSIFKRYTLLLVIIFSVTGLVYLTITLMLSQYYLKQVQTHFHLEVADALIKDNKLVQQGQLNQEAISDTFHRYMLLNPYLQIYLLDRDGRVLKFSADAKRIKRLQVDTQPILKFLSQKEKTALLGDDPRSTHEKKPFSVALLPTSKKQQAAYLYVIIQDSIEKEANRQLQESYMLQLSIYSFLFSLAIGLLLGFLLFYSLIKRIKFLSGEVSRFKRHYAVPIISPDHNQDELDQLQEDISALSYQIQQQLEQLKESDNQRRFVLSSLSHDLRTPLTNLLGYMEQVAKSQSEDVYLNTAYKNGLKLKHYLDQLFDFAKLDMCDFKLNKEELSLSEFCFDVFAPYQTQNPEWKATIKENFIYHFDPVYLERALDNLLENAATYGAGKVYLSIERQSEVLNISICSEGESIEHQLVNTPDFEPFYIKNSKGSGLGLSIVNSIAKKHGGHLKYYRENNHNCFSIVLPMTHFKY